MTKPVYGFGDNTDFIKASKEVLLKQEKEFNLLDYGLIFMKVPIRMSSYLESEQHSRLVKNVRNFLREEKGILFPVISCCVEYDDEIIGDHDILITINGTVTKGWTINPEKFENDEQELFDEADDLTYKVITLCAGLFADYNLEEEAVKISKRNGSENYKLLLNYYRLINPDKKRYFHFVKKLSALEIPDYNRELQRLYKSGSGCDKNKKAADKIELKMDRWSFRKYYWY